MTTVLDQNYRHVAEVATSSNAKPLTSTLDLRTTIIKFIYSIDDNGTIIKFFGGKSTDYCSENRAFLIIPDVYAAVQIMQPLLANLSNSFTALQYTNDQNKESIEDMAMAILPIIEKSLSPKGGPFKIFSYTFGCCIALEVARLLEQKNYYGKLVLIEGPPKSFVLETFSDDDNEFELKLISHLLSTTYSESTYDNHKEKLTECRDLREKCKYLQAALNVFPNNSTESVIELMVSLKKRIKTLFEWNTYFKLKSDIYSFRAVDGLDVSSALTPFSDKPIKVESFSGDHYSVLLNGDLLRAVDDFIATDI